MRNANRVVLIAMVFLLGLAGICSAGSQVWDLYRSQKRNNEPVSQNIERILHFPADRSVGKVFVQDANIRREIKSFHYWTNDGQEWEYYCPAKGNVRIPAGKQVKFITNWNRKPDPEDLAKLAPDDLHSLTLQCGGNKRFRADNSYMKSVGRLTGLKVLDIYDSNVTSRGLFEIRKLGELQRLSLGEGITNSGMRVVANLKSLKALYLNGCRITDLGLAKVCENLSLAELALSGEKLSDEGLAHLSKIRTLEYLMLSGNNFTDAGMAHLKNVPSLKTLHAGHAPMITDVGVKHLSEHPHLESVSFHWNENITNQGAKYLSTMRSLKMLDVGHAQIDNTGMGYLSKCWTLEYLHLPNIGLTDPGVARVAELENLKYLWVGGRFSSPLTDKCLSSVAKLKKLEQLSIGGAGIGDEGMDHIAGLGNLKELSLFKADLLTNDGLAKLARLKSLTRLSLPRRSKVSLAGLKPLNGLTNLKYLNIGGISQDYSVMDLSGLKNLEKITIGTPHKSEDLLTDADLACLSGLKKLKWFQISCSISRNGMDISGEGLKHLAGLTSIERLCLGGPNLKDADFRHFANMKKLSVLSVYGGSLTDACLRHLEGLPQLSTLNIYMENDITDEALGRLQAKLPNLSSIRINRDEKNNETKKILKSKF
ncbi:MAG: hypothetical protein FVQ79_00830 [Planctomycetes bacterium]|nr:hypothetical protein [Planctomycetota bacterium]